MRRLGPWVGFDLTRCRCDRAASEKLGLRLMATHTDRNVRRTDAAPGTLGEEPLHAPVFKRMEGDRGEPAARAEQVPRDGERLVKLAQLVVDDDPQRLERPPRRVATGELGGDRAPQT